MSKSTSRSARYARYLLDVERDACVPLAGAPTRLPSVLRKLPTVRRDPLAPRSLTATPRADALRLAIALAAATLLVASLVGCGMPADARAFGGTNGVPIHNPSQ